MRRPAIVLYCLALLSILPTRAAAAQHKKSQAHSKAVLPVPDPVPAPATAPPAPPTPEQGPSLPPEVSYAGGQLTIVARNSTMADVLNAVRQKTGAAVEMPASSSERVVGRFGPGAPRDVMAQLLNGSHYDYVLLGSPADPAVLKKVVLMARASGPEAAPATAAAENPQPQALQGAPGVEVNQGATDENTDELQPDMTQPQTDEEPQAGEQPQGEQSQPGQGQPMVKTPEQLLRELQQQQLQQQQQQQPQQPQQPQSAPYPLPPRQQFPPEQ
ncbi:MAG: hypothetical protein JO159_12360 [Acidobacteria bacterium]|nr:hypothetical protein [Acidobacteriota bacterium]